MIANRVRYYLVDLGMIAGIPEDELFGLTAVECLTAAVQGVDGVMNVDVEETKIGAWMTVYSKSLSADIWQILDPKINRAIDRCCDPATRKPLVSQETGETDGETYFV